MNSMDNYAYAPQSARKGTCQGRCKTACLKTRDCPDIKRERIVNQSIVLEVESLSEEQTEALGAEFARRIKDQTDAFLWLKGDLGAGKTAFVRGMARELCPGARVCSPTYTVMRMYQGAKTTLYHFDMYRITSEEDLESVGFYDCEGIIAAEWCENTPYALPEKYYLAEIEKVGEQTRHIRISVQTT